MTKYAGADWVQSNLKYIHPEMQMSPLGRSVADLLGELYYGIYHLDNKAIKRVDWSNTHYIEISIGWKDWSTIDFSTLTRLVFLAHHMAIRVELRPTKAQYMRVLFHQRTRAGNSYQRHPTLDEAVKAFQEDVTIPEYQDAAEPITEADRLRRGYADTISQPAQQSINQPLPESAAA